ncbi:MAG: hypothetical protein V1706_12265 [Pseudomonadota bacterium]
MVDAAFIRMVRRNCDISDARDSGIYSICSLVLKLRNLYKWEHDIEPWDEPESTDLLDWIEAKENYWETIRDADYLPLPLNGKEISPWDTEAVNRLLHDNGLFYGAGYGRSMKAVFFVAEKLREEIFEDCRALILGRESATELASPFAMLHQEETIIIRREPLRNFFWDHIMDIQSSCRTPLLHALDQYGLVPDRRINPLRIKEGLDRVIDREIPIFIYHEVGELLESTLDSITLKKIISAFPHSAIEFVCRSLKDILADTHPKGMISFIINEKRESSLGFYAGFLDGVRKVLFPQLLPSFERFLERRDWQIIEEARIRCRERNLSLAEKTRSIVRDIGKKPLTETETLLRRELLDSLGLDSPKQ